MLAAKATPENGERQQQVSLAKKQLCTRSRLFFYDHNVKLAETSQSHVLLRKCRTFSRSLFSPCRSFSPCIGDRWHFSLSPPLLLEENSNKKVSPLFFISRSRSLSPYFSLSFAFLSPTFSFSLSFSCSIFQICEHNNYSELNSLENTDTETISAFRLLSCLCFTRTRGYAISRQSNLELHLGCHSCLLSHFTLVCLRYGRTVGVRSSDYQIFGDGQFTTFSYPWCSATRVPRTRELRYKTRN